MPEKGMGHRNDKRAVLWIGVADDRLLTTSCIGCKMNSVMITQRLLRACLSVLLFSFPGFTGQSFAGQKNPPPDQKTALVSLIVVRDTNGKPVKNAEVVLHLINIHGKQMQEGLELKTHDDGKAEATGIPYGKVRIQVIAQGFRTYGEDVSVDQPTVALTIKLQKPADQFSIYK